MTRLALRVAGLVVGLAGCGGGGVIQRADELPSPPPGLGFVQIRCAPAEVEVYVDDQYLGQLDGYAEGILRVPAGPHRLMLARKGFYPWFGAIEAGPEASVIRTHLVPVP